MSNELRILSIMKGLVSLMEAPASLEKHHVQLSIPIVASELPVNLTVTNVVVDHETSNVISEFSRSV